MSAGPLRDLKLGAVSRNAALNLGSQLLPLFIAILTVPVLIGVLGPERFGVLSLAWLVLGYAGVFDLGVSRATSRRVAGLLASGRDDDVSVTATTSVMMNIALGAAGAALITLAAPSLVHDVFRITGNLAREAEPALIVVAWSLP